MEKLVRVPFDLETAKKITNGECKGKIVTRDGRSARIVCWDKKTVDYPIVALISGDGEESSIYYRNNGKCDKYEDYHLDLMLELPEPNPEPEPEHKFKPFDKVLTRDYDWDIWNADIFSHHYCDDYICIGGVWKQCIPYKGNEHLLGTTDKHE